MLQRRLHGLLIQAAVTQHEVEEMEAAAAARERPAAAPPAAKRGRADAGPP